MFMRTSTIALSLTCCIFFSSYTHSGEISLYVANEGNGTIRQFSDSGTDLGNFTSGLNAPITVLVDRSGDLFVSNVGDIQEYSPHGNLLLTISTSYSPGQVQVAANGNLLVNNYYGGDVLQYSSTGQYLGIFSNPGLQRAFYSAFDSQGNLYITDHISGIVERISSTGTDEGHFLTNVLGVAGIAFDSRGDLFVAIEGLLAPDGRDKIVEYSANGNYLGLITETGLSQPEGIAIGPDGNLYVANHTNNTITEYSLSGTYLGVFADTGLNEPNGIAFSIASVPEPSSAVLLIISGATVPPCLILRRRRISGHSTLGR
jgi:hypothetical protein